MKKSDLRTGDFTVSKLGQVGLVIWQDAEDGYLVYAENGWESLYDFDDDLVSVIDGDCIMQVFRGPRSYTEVCTDVPIIERDETWRSHLEIEADRRMEECERKQAAERAEWIAQGRPLRNGLVPVIAQAFYGSRTGTEVHKDRIDRFIQGILSDDIPLSFPVDRTIVPLPGAEGLVLMYNKHQEEHELECKARLLTEKGIEVKPLASVPELGLEIYSRCIVCRMNRDGEFESLLDEEDFEIWGRYLAE